ncbi:hypothetical protein MN116_006050 [Schistosoma mekongi]|uniref:DDB1- and CUL4-associated factor 15 WD40 repeat-containing domain-containing protein n=1 Tax=Schistosoma mekongi TaxID=38744 RepID=A0AAE2D455_SCHME|nr:hypothetical protein MN116_006050 [Schistosoma mekongi]
MIKWLHYREITRSYLVPSMDLSCGLKPYHLRQILPQSAVDDIFLGFSADGCFLVSYKSTFKHHVIRFWLFPPSRSGRTDPRLTLYGERKLSRTAHCPNLHNVPCVRFVQSLAISDSFLFLACNNDGSGFVAAFGLMPNLDCNACSEASSHDRLPTKSVCSIHSHLLPLNLDISLAQESSISMRSDINDLNFVKPSHQCISLFVPPCLYSADGNSCSSNRDHCDSSCFTSTGLPIGRIHVGVSPNTGYLRIAWANPDAQIKIISCSFKPSSNNFGNFSSCTLPKGMSISMGKYPESLVYKPPLITHNYCSTCYSWPNDNELCLKEYKSSAPPSLNSTKCIFSQDSLNIFLISDSSTWPDNHSNLLPDGAERVCHKCSNDKYLHGIHPSKLRVKNGILPDIWIPSLLSRRSCFYSCIQLTYLAMLQDIRASYLHWTLISRNSNKMDYPVNSTDLIYPVYQIDHTNDLTGNNSPISSHDRSDDETEAILTSPDSLDSSSSPEDLLVHRLSGQCHTSFDLEDWEEYIAPNVQTVTGDDNLGLNRTNEITQHRVIAHLEEVVFDIPVNSLCHEKCAYISSPVLAPFFPSDEPDLLLVYHINNDLDSSLRKTSDECTTANLIEIIDVTTGYRIPLPPKNQSSSDHIQNPTRLTSSVLRKLTSRCPQNCKISSSQCRKRLIHELNNCLMAARLESLKLLVDPQGGYSVYW